MSAINMERFRQLRNEGLSAQLMYLNAQVNELWMSLSRDGTVRIISCEEKEPYDTSFLDTWNMPEHRVEHAKSALKLLIEKEGLWTYTSSILVDSKWVEVETVHYVVGTLQKSGYDLDMKWRAIETLYTHWRERGVLV